ncbi:hypothetical protein JCM33374_g3959 [Metschnikowia sp. JCM 33374]|nr:hypothetical protein JCM33374_g3959 [Metschnikowia sp. JCM 33374]
MPLLKGSKSLSRSTRSIRSHEQAISSTVNPPNTELSSRDAASKTNTLVGSPTTQNDAMQQEKLIKALLKSFKRLEMALSKFEGKSNGITKTNILRTVVLPFLRSSLPLHSVFDMNSKLYSSFASISTSVLGSWWRSLLLCLNATGSSQVSATDRSAYLECVSRILARKEWHHADPEDLKTYTMYLSETLDFSILRLLSFKVVPISISAFVGKVFAYSFFNLPGVCNALLFLLNVKQKTLDKSASSFLPLSQASKDKAVSLFPRYVSHLIDYKGLEKLEKVKRGAINCVTPPTHPVRGIRDPSGPWVRRWCSSDSDIFNSFFRHYINIAHSFSDDCSLFCPASFPGFRVIIAYIYSLISVSLNRISFTKASTNMGSSIKQINSPSEQKPPTHAKEGTTGSGLPPSSLSFKQADSNYTSITKLFRSIRDISCSSIPFANQITRIIDSLFVNVAKQIYLYDVNKTSLLLNLVYEYSIHIFDASDMDWEFWLGCNYLMLTNTYHVQIITRNFAFLFNVWDKIPNVLPENKVTNSNTWLKDSNESLKSNFSSWLTSSSVWLDYFVHWNPLVRSHYIRLLVWRVIGVNNYENSRSIQTTHRIKQKTDLMFERVREILDSEDLPRDLALLDFSPDSPIVNRKFGIVPINNKFSYLDEISSLMSVAALSKPSDLRKTHAYEIFDEAVYTCTSLPSSPGTSVAESTDSNARQKSTGNHSIIDSLSRFFKMLSTDDPSGKDALAMAPPKKLSGNRNETGVLGRGRPLSKSMTSLSTALSMKSSSSSPSLASFQSSPDSMNDQSTESSITSDSDSSISDRFGGSSASTYSSSSISNSQPPELFKIPPEIIRPIFKLDIVLDHELTSFKYSKMQQSKFSWNNASVFYGSKWEKELSFITFPKPPKTPSVSIFLNSDAYNKFFITRETYSIDEKVLSVTDVGDFRKFSTDLSEKLDRQIDLVTSGKSLNEWNAIVQEFESYLFEKVEADQANYLPISSIDGEVESHKLNEINECDYFARIIPFLPIDNFTESKLLNAS